MTEDQNRDVLRPAEVHPSVAAKVATKSELVEAARSAIADNAVVVLGMRQNPFPRKARKLLDGAQIPYMYLEWGSYGSMWKERLELKMWTGWKTFPMIFVCGQFIGGFTELEKLHESGELSEMLAKEAAA